jgi:hypothetical protein
VADYFRETFEGLKQTAEALMVANEAMVRANAGIKRAVEAALAPKNEHEDLRETVYRLEVLVLDLTKQMQELRRQQS